MDKYEKLLNMLMDFDESVRFTAVCDSNGEIMWHSQRSGIKNMIPLADTKKTLLREVNAWKERDKISNFAGQGMYVIAAYEKIKRITIPLDQGNLLFISCSNAPLLKSKEKSYGHLVEMGKILSIVDFVKSAQ